MAEIHLIPDRTFFVQCAISITVICGLSYFIFKPIKKLFNLRKKNSSDLLEEAKAIQSKTEILTQEYLSKIKAAREEALSEKEKIRKETDEQEQSIRNKAREETVNILDKAKKEIEESKIKTLKELEIQIPKFTDEIIKKLRE